MIASAGGLISLLDEPNVRFQCAALTKLIAVVDSHWPEIASVIPKIEAMHESDKFPERQRAALLASKVHFHLGSYEDALMYALGAEGLFDVNAHTEYTDTIISKCIDHYAKLRTTKFEAGDADLGEKTQQYSRLEGVVNRMFERCFAHKQYKQAVGIAIETHRLDMFARAIKDSNEPSALLSYAVSTILSVIQHRQYRNEMLRSLVRLYTELPQPDFINVCQCLVFLDEPADVAGILTDLIEKSDDGTLTAYQIAFDLYENATQQFIARIISSLKRGAPIPIADESSSASNELGTEKKESADESMEEKSDDAPSETPAETSTAKVQKKENLSKEMTQKQDRIEKVAGILSGEHTINLHRHFLIKNNHTDMLILKNCKDSVRNSVGHTATVIANSLMHCGTTCDDFLRDNLEWVSKATNWSKFTAVASLGVIHKGHEKDALRIMETYLPKNSSAATSGYMESGALYALGLIFANHGTAIIDYLKKQLSAANLENVRHGACLGIGLAAMGTHRSDIYEQLLNDNLYQDDAITGESAGIALGMVMLGSAQKDALEEMVRYAQETQHEKIMRGLSIGIALVMFGRLEEAEPLITQLLSDKDANLRRSGVFTIAMAYCGTGSNAAVQRLLRIAVKDVNDDVKRAAVTSLGFVLFRTPDQCPRMVSLLAESYNPHVRYGAALALAIACAGTGSREAIALLEPMLNDATSYVRQGCMIAMAMIMIQHNEVTCPKVKEFRETLSKIISDKLEDTMAKFGAVISQGLLDAGGRNVTISLQSRTGQTDTESVVGVLLFLQYWYWFPLTHMLSLALKPTALIGLHGIDLTMPKMEFQSNARPSIFGYVPALEEKKEKTTEKVETAVLSVTAKYKRKEQAKKDKDKMEVDEDEKKSDAETAAKSSDAEAMDTAASDSDAAKSKGEADEKNAEKDKVKKASEPTFSTLENPARVMKQQAKIVAVATGETRYDPLKPLSHGGIIIMRDRRPEEEIDRVEAVKPGGLQKSEEEEEPGPPEPFQYVESA